MDNRWWPAALRNLALCQQLILLYIISIVRHSADKVEVAVEGKQERCDPRRLNSNRAGPPAE